MAWLGAFLIGFDSTALNIAVPMIATDFDIGLSAASWVILIYILVVVCCGLLAGSLANTVGGRRLLIFGFCIFAVGSLLCAVATELYALIAFRALQALGGSILYVLGPAVIRRSFAGKEQDWAFGLYCMAPSVGICLGPALGGLVAGTLGWPWILLMNLPVCLLALFAVWGLPAEQIDQGRSSVRLDLVGAGLGALSLAGLVVALNQGRELGFGSPIILSCFCAFAVGIVVFVIWEVKAPAAALDLRVFRITTVGLASLSNSLLLFVYAGASFLLPVYLVWYQGLSVVQAGIVLMLLGGLNGVLSAQFGRLTRIAKGRTIATLGGLAVALGLTRLAVAGPEASLVLIVLSSSLIGLGMGSQAIESLEPAEVGFARDEEPTEVRNRRWFMKPDTMD
ncbi:MAG: MFS transporter, partial [Alphaproteobacteria bacterium]